MSVRRSNSITRRLQRLQRLIGQRECVAALRPPQIDVVFWHSRVSKTSPKLGQFTSSCCVLAIKYSGRSIVRHRMVGQFIQLNEFQFHSVYCSAMCSMSAPLVCVCVCVGPWCSFKYNALRTRVEFQCQHWPCISRQV